MCYCAQPKNARETHKGDARIVNKQQKLFLFMDHTKYWITKCAFWHMIPVL